MGALALAVTLVSDPEVPTGTSTAALAQPLEPTTTVGFDDLTADAELVVLPGSGRVVAQFELDGMSHLLVDGSIDSVLWQKQDVWRIVDSFTFGGMVDAIGWNGQAVVVPDGSFGDPVVLIGSVGDLSGVELPVAAGEVPHRVEDLAGRLVVYTRRFGSRMPDQVVEGSGSPLISNDGEHWTRLPLDEGDRVYDALVIDNVVHFAGSSDGVPSMWREEPDGEVRLLDLNRPTVRGAITSVAVVPSGEVVVLVVLEGNSPQTGVWRLVGGELREFAPPLSGVLDQLVVVPGGLVATPETGSDVHVSTDGRSWQAIPLSGSEIPGDLDISVAFVDQSGGVTFGGGSRFDSTPVLAQSVAVGFPYELPDPEWRVHATYEPGIGVVYLDDRLELGYAVVDGVRAPRGNLLSRVDGADEWTESDLDSSDFSRAVFRVVQTSWGWVAIGPGVAWRSLDGSTWTEVGDWPGLNSVVGTDGTTVIVADTIDSALLIGETDISVIPSPDGAQAVGWIDGLGFVIASGQGRVSTAHLLSDGEWIVIADSVSPHPMVIMNGKLARVVDSILSVFDPATRFWEPVEGSPAEAPTYFGPFLPATSAVWAGVHNTWYSSDLENWRPLRIGVASGFRGRFSGFLGSEGELILATLDDDDRLVLYRHAG